MKKVAIIFLFYFIVILTGCSNEQTVNTTKEKLFNDQDIGQSISIALDKIEKLEKENQILSQENKQLQKQVSEFQGKSMLMSKVEVIDLLKSTNNENPIFYSESSFRDNEKFKLINSDSKPIYDYLKSFLQKMYLE